MELDSQAGGAFRNTKQLLIFLCVFQGTVNHLSELSCACP